MTAFGMAYLPESCYSRIMKGRIDPPVPAKRRTRLRQAFLVFLTAAYVLVGFGGEITCAEESLGIPFASIGVNATAGGTDDADTKNPTVVDHCYSCAPLTVPAAPAVREPASPSRAMCFRCGAISVLEARLLDTPPPKSSI